MNLPFGIQLRGVLVGILAAWFIIPWVQAQFMRMRRSPSASAAA